MSLLNKYGFTEREMEYLTPKPIRKMNLLSRIWSTFLIVVTVLALAAAVIIVLQHIYPFNYHAQAAEGVVVKDGKEFKLGTFCAQAILDHDSYGRDLSQSLKDYCGI